MTYTLADIEAAHVLHERAEAAWQPICAAVRARCAVLQPVSRTRWYDYDPLWYEPQSRTFRVPWVRFSSDPDGEHLQREASGVLQVSVDELADTAAT